MMKKNCRQFLVLVFLAFFSLNSLNALHINDLHQKNSQRDFLAQAQLNVAIANQSCFEFKLDQNSSLGIFFNCLKPLLKKDLRLNTQTSNIFGAHSSEFFDLDFCLRQELSYLVDSEYLTQNSIKAKASELTLIEGDLTVSF